MWIPMWIPMKSGILKFRLRSTGRPPWRDLNQSLWIRMQGMSVDTNFFKDQLDKYNWIILNQLLNQWLHSIIESFNESMIAFLTAPKMTRQIIHQSPGFPKQSGTWNHVCVEVDDVVHWDQLSNENNTGMIFNIFLPWMINPLYYHWL